MMGWRLLSHHTLCEDLYVSMPFLILLTSRDARSRVFQLLVCPSTAVPLLPMTRAELCVPGRAISLGRSTPPTARQR